MAFSLFPAYVVVTYTTAFGIHTMTLPLRNWTAGTPTPLSGNVQRWSDDANVELETMLSTLLTTLAEFLSTSCNFGRYTVFTMASVDAIPVPRYTNTLNISGTAAPASLDEAVQLTFHFKTEDFNESKLTLLDAKQPDGFNKILNPLSFADVPALAANWTDEDFGWAGRDGARPATIYSITCGLNDGLRQAYRDA